MVVKDPWEMNSEFVFGDLFVCKCSILYTGKNCDVGVPCEIYGRPCMNGGICTNTEGYDDYVCSCGEDWTGRNCTLRCEIFRSNERKKGGFLSFGFSLLKFPNVMSANASPVKSKNLPTNVSTVHQVPTQR